MIVVVQTSLRPMNSLILVLDPTSGEIPLSMDRRLVASTPSCVAVGTLCEADGETAITLTDDSGLPRSDPAMQLAFEAIIDTPRRDLSVCTVDLKPVLSLRVSTKRTRIEIWANHPSEPDRICVLVRNR